MSGRLESFLHCDDLDEAARLAEDLQDLTDEEQRRVHEVLELGADVQGVANLLVEARLIAPTERAAVILRHLHGDRRSYLTMAACVGAGMLRAETTVEREDAEVAGALCALAGAEDTPPVTAQRASAALVELAGSAPFEEVLVLLGHGDPVVAHNAVAAVVAVVGVERAAHLLTGEAAVHDVGQAVREQLEVARRLPPFEQATVPVALPLLAYLPNLADWPG